MSIDSTDSSASCVLWGILSIPLVSLESRTRCQAIGDSDAISCSSRLHDAALLKERGGGGRPSSTRTTFRTNCNAQSKQSVFARLVGPGHRSCRCFPHLKILRYDLCGMAAFQSKIKADKVALDLGYTSRLCYLNVQYPQGPVDSIMRCMACVAKAFRL